MSCFMLEGEHCGALVPLQGGVGFDVCHQEKNFKNKSARVVLL